MQVVTHLTLQEYAWLAAGIGGVLAVVQLAFNLIRETRVRRLEQARFGYELLDSIFDDPTAGLVLLSLDSGTWRHSRRAKDAEFLSRFGRAFGEELDSADEALVMARIQFDSVLYFFDRCEHAIQAGLTKFEDVRAPLAWYVGLMRPFKAGIINYAEMVEYHRPLAFLERFASWRGPHATDARPN